jgi:GntR family transcriptional repressor for pyruvate dehydrogenase complex
MPRRQSLSVEVADDIKKKILRGTLKPGAQIRTEAELCKEYEVSRTVVREAISRLRSDGMLIARQGLGVFVSNSHNSRRFEVDWDSIRTLPDTISLLELRLAIEVESAGLCALRRSQADAKNIRQWMDKANRQFKSLQRTKLHYDFDFHLAIAKGTKNPHFYELLLFLRPIIVPRIRLGALVSEEAKENYEQIIRTEHEAVVASIEAGDERAARENMRTHLLNSLERLRSLAASYGVKGSKKRGDSVERALRSFVQGLSSDDVPASD